MGYTLSLEKLPVWAYSSFRYFEKHERHVSRTYPWSVLVMVFEGVLRFYENGQPVEVKAGEFYIQRHGMRQEGRFESDAPKYYFIQWTGGEYIDGEDGLPLSGKADFTELFPLFNELETLKVTGAPLVEKSAIFYKILSLLKKKSIKKSASGVVAKVVSLVTADLRNPFSLDAVASCCGYSKNHIIGIFKTETGMTPYAYVTEIKLNMAKQLLENSESSLTSISIECGFGSYINLYRTFIKNVGCSPADWRKAHRDV